MIFHLVRFGVELAHLWALLWALAWYCEFMSGACLQTRQKEEYGIGANLGSQITGHIQIACGAAFSGAALSIRLLDVSRADAASTIVAEQIVPDVRCAAGDTLIVPFSISDLIIQPQTYYSISAHCDVDGDRSISAGDFISMESYPVLTFGYPNEVIVRLYVVP